MQRMLGSWTMKSGEQIEIPKGTFEMGIKFMKLNDNVNILRFEGEILGVILPDKVALQVVECEPAVKGDTATSASKNAVLESGLEIKTHYSFRIR